MDSFNAFLLGLLQGLTEFLPISSSGHLVLGQHLFGIGIPGNALEVVLHMGTLFSIILVFWKDLITILTNLHRPDQKKFAVYIIVGTLPVAAVGLLFKDTIEGFFDSTKMVGLMLLVTATILFLTRYLGKRNRDLDLKSALMVGIAQAFAIMPGISRSGATIGMGIFLGIPPATAARFSFIMAIPALMGAGLLTALNTDTIQVPVSVLLTGFFSSFLSGYIALKWLLGLLKSGKFHWFGFYCLIIGLTTLLV